MNAVDVDQMLRPLMLKDLRTECRLRGLNPGGAKDALADRVKEHMFASRDFRLLCEMDAAAQSQQQQPAQQYQQQYQAGLATGDIMGGTAQNNYSRPEGQNVGNFMTDRPSSRVLAQPGGGSQIVFGNSTDAMDSYRRGGPPQGPPQAYNSPPPGAPHWAPPQQVSSGGSPYSQSPQRGGPAVGTSNNNYHRPSGQNVGNFLTDKPSSRVLAPPGGRSQISFG